jgi:hypothetical protein
MARDDYSVADVVNAMHLGSLEGTARVAQLFPALVSGLLIDAIDTLAAIIGQQKAAGIEEKVRASFKPGSKKDKVEAAVDKEIAAEPEPEPAPEPEAPTQGDLLDTVPGGTEEPAPAPEKPAKGKGKGKAASKTEAPAVEPAKAEKGTKTKAEDDLDALLDELEDAGPGDADGEGEGEGDGDGDGDGE